MKTQEIINILTELAFSDRLLDPVEREAAATAISVLRSLADVEALAEVKGGTVIPGAIVSAPLAPLLLPYHGCPRGHMGFPGASYIKNPCLDGALRLLNDSAKYIITGQDESFICVPEMWFKACVMGLQRCGAQQQSEEVSVGKSDAEISIALIAAVTEGFLPAGPNAKLDTVVEKPERADRGNQREGI